MLYLLAFFFPFMSVFFVGKPFQAAINLVIWLMGFLTFGIGCIIAFLHAILVVHGAHADRRTKAIVAATRIQNGSVDLELTAKERAFVDEMVRRSR